MKLIAVILIITSYLYSFEDIAVSTKKAKIQPQAKKEKVENENSSNAYYDLRSVQKAYFKKTDDAVIAYKYNPKSLMKIRTRVMAKTTVILPYGEAPILTTNGNEGNFKLELMKDKDSKYDISNIFTISTKNIGVDTSLTILSTKGKTYNFYLYSIGQDNKEIANQTVYITKDGNIPVSNNYENLDERDKKILELESKINEYKAKLDIQEQKNTKNLRKFNIANIQLDYRFKKEDDFKLKAVFNDDEFTYFKFDLSNGFKKFPAVFRVIDGYDNPVNFEIVNDYLVAKVVNDKFTLRRGEKHNCIRLEK